MVKQGYERRHEGLKVETNAVVEKFSEAQVSYAKAKLGHEPSGGELTLLCGNPEDGVSEDLEVEHSSGIVSASAVVGSLDQDEWKQVDAKLRFPHA